MADDILDDLDEFEGFDLDAEVIRVKLFYNSAKANIYAARLREEGIKTFLSSSNMNAVIPSNFSQIGLHIKKEDEEQALIIIQEMDVQYESDNPSFSIKEASSEDALIEQQLIHERKQANDPFFVLIIAVLAVIIIIALFRNVLF